mgnify:FL=1
MNFLKKYSKFIVVPWFGNFEAYICTLKHAYDTISETGRRAFLLARKHIGQMLHLSEQTFDGLLPQVSFRDSRGFS